MGLTKMQKEVLELGRKKGFLVLEDFYKIYSSEKSRTSAINRLLLLGLIRDEGRFRFKIIKYDL